MKRRKKKNNKFSKTIQMKITKGEIKLIQTQVKLQIKMSLSKMHSLHNRKRKQIKYGKHLIFYFQLESLQN
jgi:hypothetical protein